MDATSLFDYIMIPPAIVLGLAITHMLGGFGRVAHRLAGYGPGIRLDWIHLAWVAHVFVWMIFFWWYSYAWTTHSEWSLLVFVFLVVYTIVLYFMSVILVPSDLDDVTDFATYFMSLRGWFFGGVILLILVDFADSAIKGWDNVVSLGIGYLSLRTTLLAGCVVALRTQSRPYHGAFALVALVWTFLFFWLNRPTLSAG